MADSLGRNPGDQGYDPSTDPMGANPTAATTAAPAAPAAPVAPAPFVNTSTNPGTGSININGQAVTGTSTANTPVTATGADPWLDSYGNQTNPNNGGVGYNGNTGASAHYDAASGMWIDSNGQSIRPDAIQMTPPGATASGGSSGPAAAAPSSAFNDQVRAMILQQLQQAGQPVDPNSPEIASTMSAANDAATRSSDAERTALAERLYAQGGTNTDAITREIQQSGEKNAQASSALKASLLTNEYNQKLQQMQGLLSLAVQSGDTQSAQAIQLQIAQLQAAVQREGLGVNLSEFGAQLNQNAALAALNG